MNNTNMLRELNSIDPELVESYMLRECYERTIPHAVRVATGAYPYADGKWKPSTRETFAENTARFVRDVLQAYYNGNAALYSNRQRLERFMLKIGDKAIRLYSCRSYHSPAGDTHEILNILHLAITGTIPEYKVLDIEADRLNTYGPFLADSHHFNEVIKIGDHALKLRMFKNRWFEVKGLTPDMIKAIESVKELASRPM